MKKTLLSIATLALSLTAAAQAYVPETAGHVTKTGVSEDFKIASQFSDTYSSEGAEFKYDATGCSTKDKAYGGVFSWVGTAEGFSAPFTRNSDGGQAYVVTQPAKSYAPIGFGFGSYCNSGSEGFYVLDLSANATISFDFENLGTAPVKIQVAMADLSGKIAGFNKTVLGTSDEDWKHQLQTSVVDAGKPGSFNFNYKDAVTGGYGSTHVADLDYTQIKQITLTIVNGEDSETKELVSQKVVIKNLKIGSEIVSIKDELVNETFKDENITVYNMVGNVIATGTTETITLNPGFYIIKSATKTQKVIIK